jgi:hypothetical protein
MSIAGIWGIITRYRHQAITGNYWGILAVGELLILGQGLLGAYLWIIGERPGRDKYASLAYGLLCLFLAAISMRAMATGV